MPYTIGCKYIMDCLLNDVAVKIPDTILDDDNAFEEFF